ncbi:MAG: hypothetical protein CM15mP12_5030 [Gammaproteobacteria bacterium]|nr:MAG: hypothetical protein CM15mP12_5030 [Gammaproteobacteria bacterium]
MVLLLRLHWELRDYYWGKGEVLHEGSNGWICQPEKPDLFQKWVGQVLMKPCHYAWRKRVSNFFNGKKKKFLIYGGPWGLNINFGLKVNLSKPYFLKRETLKFLKSGPLYISNRF